MTLAVQRDPDVVVAAFVAWLRDQDPAGAPELVGYERPSDGLSSETFLVDVRGAGSDRTVGQRLVLRLPPPNTGIFPRYDLMLQARAQEAAADGGVPAPVPVQVETDPKWLGADFLVMPAVAGHVPDPMPFRDHWLTKVPAELNATLYGNYIDVIADINRVDWRHGDLADVVPVRDNAAEIAYWRDYLGWYADGTVLVPALVDALEWCEARRPATEPDPSFLWGDVRLGNVIFDDERTPVAVLDWEMASIGAAEHDLAWCLTLEATQDELFQRTMPGFLDHDAAVRRYEARLGRPVHDLPWYEIFGLVRSTAIMSRVAHLHELAGLPAYFPIADNPILAILQRRIDAFRG
ncbi:MAG: aminoglycoside phosphotransferase [Actinomycetia bacterium]|nr:aminoglycoside phosphotransferase [Actinomycetes bacterium]